MNSENNSPIITNVAWKLAERILAQLVSLVVSFVLARVLLPDDYGAIAMVLVFISIADTLIVGGFPSALIQKKNADRLDFSTVFIFNSCLSLLIYSILFFLSPVIADYYQIPLLSVVIRVMGLDILICSFSSIQHSYVSRNMMFKKYFWSTLLGTITSGIVGIILAVNGFGVWALVAQYLLNSAIDSIFLWFSVKWRPHCEFSWERLSKLLKYGWKILFEGLSNTFFGQLNNLVIGKVYTSSDLGFYSKAGQIPNLVVTNISSALSSVLFPAMSKEQDDSDKILTMLRKSVRVSSYLLFPMLVGLVLVAEPLISVLLTDKWLESVPYLRIFCFTNAATIGMIPRHEALKSIGRSDVYMNEHIIGRVVSIIILLLVYRISVMAVALCSVVSTLILTIIIMFTSRTYNGYSFKNQIKDVIPTILGCIVMAVFVSVIPLLGLDNLPTLVLQILVGIAVYTGFSALFKIKEYSFIMEYVLSFIRRKK